MPNKDLAVIVSASTEQLASDLGKAAGMVRAWAKTVDRESQNAMAGGKGASQRAVFVRGASAFARGGMSAAHFAVDNRAARGAANAFRDAASGAVSFAKSTLAVAAGSAMAQAGITGLSGVLDTLKESVNLAADLESLTLSFEVMLGSAQKGSRMVADLRKFAAETPFDTKGTIDAARQLLAYGVAAEQIIPTLTVLGDVTAGLGGRTSLGDMAYLYGTLNTQGRAFSKDIYQFTNRGVDLLGPLARQFGKTTGEVMKLVEEGRVGIPEVGKALESLRGPGGHFENLMARQSKTLAGMWERAKDAWDIARTKFGQVVIEEVGLKEASADFEAFAGRVEKAIAAENSPVRKGVRFMGDLARAVVQTGDEFGRAAYRFAEIKLEGIDFQKIDATGWGFGLFEAVAIPLARSIDWAQEFGASFRTNVIAPVNEWIERLQTIPDILHDITHPSEWFPEGNWGKGAADQRAAQRDMMAAGGWRNRELVAKFKQEAFHPEYLIGGMPAEKEFPRLFSARRPNESDAQYAKRFKDLETLIDSQAFVASRESPAMRPHETKKLNDLLQLRLENFLAPHATEAGDNWPRIKEAFEAGRVPAFRPGFGPMSAEKLKTLDNRNDLAAGQPEKAVSYEDMARQALKEARDSHARDQAVKAAAAQQNALAESAGRAAATLDGFTRGGGWQTLLSLMGPGGSVVGGMIDAGPRTMDRMRAGMALAPFPANAMFQQDERLLKFERKAPPDVLDFASKIKDEMDPLREIGRYKADIDRAVGFGTLTKEEGNWAYDSHVRGVAGRMGIGGEPHLAGAALAGSAEDAKILTAHMAGNTGRQTTDQLLAQILAVLQQTRQNTKDTARAAGDQPKPVASFFPTW